MSSTTLITDIAQGFFENLGLNFSDLEVIVQNEEQHIYMVKIRSEDSALLIGLHGRTLDEIQSILVQMCEKALGSFCLIHLEINDYLAEKQKKLFAIVDRKVDLARKNGIDQVVYELSSYERKQVHAYIGDTYPDIETKSIDGEKGRELHVRLKEGIAPTGEPVAPPTKPSKTSDITADLAALDLDSANI
jgi:predicted RNA-binding protein Jag